MEEKLMKALERIENSLKLNNLNYVVKSEDSVKFQIEFIVSGLNFSTTLSLIGGNVVTTLSCDEIHDGHVLDVQDLLDFINNCSNLFCKEINLINNFKAGLNRYEIKDTKSVIESLVSSNLNYVLVTKNKINILRRNKSCTVNFVDDRFVIVQEPNKDKLQLFNYKLFMDSLSCGQILN